MKERKGFIQALQQGQTIHTAPYIAGAGGVIADMMFNKNHDYKKSFETEKNKKVATIPNKTLDSLRTDTIRYGFTPIIESVATDNNVIHTRKNVNKKIKDITLEEYVKGEK